MNGARILITGAAGFAGRHLAEQLRRRSQGSLVGLDALADPGLPLDDYLPCDITDPRAVDDAVGRADPDIVFHLAGLLGGAPADELWKVNVGGFESLCLALRRRHRARPGRVRMVVVGSAAELGTAGARRLPVPEDAPCLPESDYGRSKLKVTELALAEPADSPLAIVVARPFNLVGPGLSVRLSLGNFARQVAAVAAGRQDAVRCGPLDARRDFVDVRDAAEAFALLAEHGRAGEIYNVCLGRSFRIGDLLDLLLAQAGRAVPVIVENSHHRAGDLPDIYGDPQKITREVGWRPTTSVEQSVVEMFTAAWEEGVKTSKASSLSGDWQQDRGLVDAVLNPPSPPAPLPLGTNLRLVPNGRGE
jgi:GDP-4-dehydro-6-deoxy-D-mannose reductase